MSTDTDANRKFTGLDGWWDRISKLGSVGLCFLLLGYLVYSQQKQIGNMQSEAAKAHELVGGVTGAMNQLRDSQTELTHAVKVLSSDIRKAAMRAAAAEQPEVKDTP